MMHIAILQIYCGASGQFGSYNCQEVGLAKAFAALGHRCTVAYPDTMAEAAEERCVRLCPGAQALFLPAKGLGVHAFYNLDFLFFCIFNSIKICYGFEKIFRRFRSILHLIYYICYIF